MAKVTDIVHDLSEPIVVENGCTIWDVEYVREGGTWFLRLYIDKPGGVNITDCENVSRAVSDKLDEVDPIPSSYTFEVSSAGADRVLRKPEHFAAYIGEEVELKLFRPRDGRKVFVGILKTRSESGSVTLTVGDSDVEFTEKEIAQIRLSVAF